MRAYKKYLKAVCWGFIFVSYCASSSSNLYTVEIENPHNYPLFVSYRVSQYLDPEKFWHYREPETTSKLTHRQQIQPHSVAIIQHTFDAFTVEVDVPKPHAEIAAPYVEIDELEISYLGKDEKWHSLSNPVIGAERFSDIDLEFRSGINFTVQHTGTSFSIPKLYTYDANQSGGSVQTLTQQMWIELQTLTTQLKALEKQAAFYHHRGTSRSAA